MSSIKVSVVIPTYNYGHYLPEAIESVLSQTYPIYEVIVVDDGSTDDTAKVAERFGDKITYVYQENSGLSAARNTGIRHSSGDFIAFLDSDDIWLPEKIEKQVALFDLDPEIGMVYCSAREFDSSTGDTLELRSIGKEGWVADDLLMFEEPVVIAIGSTGVVRREVFDSVGDFDTALRHSEDWDFSYRVARRYKIGYVREVLAGYRNHGTNMHKNVASMEQAMTHCFAKAFDTDDRAVLRLRDRAYGNLYSVLAGSYFYTGDYGAFFRCSLRSVWLRPQMLVRFAAFPLRRLRRKGSGK